jgi:hypothetical protein
MTTGEPNTLDPLDETASARWDELVAPYAGAKVFHRRAWLDYLAESRGADMRLWGIREGDSSIGYFCGGLVRKGPFLVLGSPLKGWGTNSMGPLAERGFDQEGFLGALDDLAARHGIAMTELESPLLEAAGLAAHGYEPVQGWTYRVSLTPGDPERMWRALDSAARNRVRKAMRAGLSVEDTDDPAIAEEFYDQYSALVRHKGFAPPYPREYPRLLVRHLKKADLLFALRVRDASGRVLATGLFPHDGETVYFWGGASWQDGRDQCPNELLHWSLICLAASRGLHRYDMCGPGRFKKKFGGDLVELARWHKSYSVTAEWARRAYALYFEKQTRVRGWWERMTRQSRGAHQDQDDR